MTRNPVTRLLVSLALLAAAAAATSAEDPRETADPGQFVQKALLDGMTEVQLGKLAQQKGKSTEVKAFGTRMVADHGKANTELAALARTKKLKVPATLDPEHREVVDELTAKSGVDFDAAYSQHMADDHAKAIRLFTQATQGLDAQLAAFAKGTLPVLTEHKRMADALARSTQLPGEPASTSSQRQ